MPWRQPGLGAVLAVSDRDTGSPKAGSHSWAPGLALSLDAPPSVVSSLQKRPSRSLAEKWRAGSPAGHQ